MKNTKSQICFVLCMLMVVMLAGCAEQETTITLKEYEEIRSGMTYEEVCNIIGGEPISINGLSPAEYFATKDKPKENSQVNAAGNSLNGVGGGTQNETPSSSNSIASLFAETNTVEEMWCIWQGKKVSNKSEYRGEAVITFANNIAKGMSQSDLK